MNNMQKIASEISGFDYHESGAKNDGYYDQSSVRDKITFIMELSESSDSFETVDHVDALRIMNFLDAECSNFNDTYYEFKNLEKDL